MFSFFITGSLFLIVGVIAYFVLTHRYRSEIDYLSDRVVILQNELDNCNDGLELNALDKRIELVKDNNINPYEVTEE